MRAANALKLVIATTAIAGGIVLGAGAAYAGSAPDGGGPAPAPSSPSPTASTNGNNPWD